MNARLFVKKLTRYISCAVKCGAAYICAPFVRKKNNYRDLWIIAERGVDARDNGYYLFKYITKSHPEINIAYVISKDSPDRERVLQLGRVINYGSFEHFVSLVLAKVKISTHIMGFTPYIDFFVRADKLGLVRGKKIFLQHGIIKDNLKYLYSDNVNIDLFICSAKPEYEYVRDNFGYSDGVVKMLGLCRYDDLYKIEKSSGKILLMPTWRYNLTGAGEKEFCESGYYKAYERLLCNKKLNEILNEYNYELLFYPHMEMQKFISCFSGGDRVKVVSFRYCTVQSLLINSDVLITDFSSVFFDYAYMEKPMIFYQFDKAEFRNHHYSEGYFDYERDAFGKVVYDEDALLVELSRILARGTRADEEYIGRIHNFFTLKDRNNSERNFLAIEEILRG